MMSAESRPRLAAKARLRFDRRTNCYLLLYPECGLELNATAAEIVKLCTGTHTVRAILAHLAATPGAPSPDVVAQEALTFLDRLAARGLLRDEP